MEDDEGYMVLNLQPKKGNATRPSPGGSQESPQSPCWHGVVLKVGCAGIVVLLVTVAVLSVWVFQGFSNKAEDGLALRNDDFTQRPRSGRECNASVENLFSRLKQSLCDPVQINPAGGSRCKLCPTEWMLHGDKCYWVSKETNIWSKSSDDCSKKGSQMLVIQHQEQMDYLQPFMPDDNPVWIGLTFNASERKWIWVDGSHLNGERFPGLSQAEESICGVLKRKKIDFDICDNKLKWICQKAAFLL
ncbi:killer cell lectin-like receptor subfamily B member 1 [Emydura macquarii macquarii]|uniref:killer cell lectin-like receptor subfamily B member 1 n=1 Tax=Emydura macquarii macquarii TaxID=1129001 RepID=UPI00352BA7F1